MVLRFSIVAPVHNESAVLPEFLRRVIGALDATGREGEVIIVDDGSTDDSWAIVERAARDDRRIKALRLFRNHGHQLALSAGLAASEGELVMTIDADLQDPPELLGPMVERMEREAADVVYAVRRTRVSETRWKLLSAYLFYRGLRALSGPYIQTDSGDFRLMRREVVDIINLMPERHRFLRAMIAWVGGTQVPFEYDREPRFAGETKFSTVKMVRLAVDAVISFSLQPLRLSVLLSGFVMILGIALSVWAAVSYLVFDTARGWASLMGATSLLFALQFFIIGVIGEYVGRIGESVKSRPLYLVKSSLGFPGPGTGDERLRSGD